MLDDTGARRQESLRQNPAVERNRTFPYPIKGIVTAVFFKDQSIGKQTMVDIKPMGGYSDLYKVPLLSAKTNATEGEEWTLEPGDIVVVMFIGGNWNDPIVTGCCNLPDNLVQATSTDAPAGKRRYHKRCNKTDIVIDKDGNRISAIEKDESLTIKGQRTTIIEGNETLTINSGDITIDVTAGKCTVHVAGKTAWTSDGTVEIDGGSGAVKGVVQGDCLCSYSGKPHPMVSATVKASV